jgi:hypothetical protein
MTQCFKSFSNFALIHRKLELVRDSKGARKSFNEFTRRANFFFLLAATLFLCTFALFVQILT